MPSVAFDPAGTNVGRNTANAEGSGMDNDTRAALAELLHYFETTHARMMPFRGGRGKRQANADDVREHAADKIRAFDDAHGIW